jgi:hypothetical protein
MKPSRAAYILAIVTNRKKGGETMQSEHEIDALLSPSEAGSIFDRLMAMPRTGKAAAETNEWDRAVANRFQAHLARQMRTVIDGGIDRGGCQQHAA